MRNTQEKFEETKQKHEEKINSLEKILCLHCLEEHEWKISGFNEQLRLAETGEEIKIDSSPFYTGACGRYGYKFKIRLYIVKVFVAGLAEPAIQLSAYFVIMKGECDSLLPWPFRRKVNFTLVDQQEYLNDRENIVRSIKPDPTNDGEWNMRPVTDENYGRKFGYSLFGSTLRQRRFIVDDTIYLKVTVLP